MSVAVDPDAIAGKVRAVRAENEWIAATVLPEVGAKIYDFVAKKSGRQILWHNPRIPPHRFEIEANFDNHWCGGWDEGFPTCDACEYRGESYPNLGELRSLEWSLDSAAQEDGSAVVRLSAFGPISPVRAVKTVTVSAGSPVLRVNYELQNLGPAAVDFIWGSHPALAITPATRFRVPGRTGIVGVSSDERLGVPGRRYAWPMLDGHDMSRALPFDANLNCGHYVTDLDAGWFAAEETGGAGVLFTFAHEQCRWLWLWLSYGGWRGYHHAILEPWTSCPVHLADAVRQGTSRRLEPGGRFTAEVRAVPYEPPETWRDALERAGQP